jgi:hypothetical protein
MLLRTCRGQHQVTSALFSLQAIPHWSKRPDSSHHTAGVSLARLQRFTQFATRKLTPSTTHIPTRTPPFINLPKYHVQQTIAAYQPHTICLSQNHNIQSAPKQLRYNRYTTTQHHRNGTIAVAQRHVYSSNNSSITAAKSTVIRISSKHLAIVEQKSRRPTAYCSSAPANFPGIF